MMKLIMPLLLIFMLPNLNKKYFWAQIPAVLLIITCLSLPLLSPLMATPLTSCVGFMVDPLGAPLIILTIWISILMITASSSIMNNKMMSKPFLITIMSLTLILVSVFSVSNFMVFYIMFEASLIPTLFLILVWGYQPERLQAGIYLMMYTLTASLPLMISLLFIFSTNLSLSMLNQWFISPHLPSLLTAIWWGASIMAFLVKLPLFISHIWLPKAHVEAPLAGSMILAAILLKIGAYGLLRMSFILPQSNSLVAPFLNSMALWGALLTSLICLRQTDMKALIAYSSVGHMAILLAGTMTNTFWGWNGALAMMLTHGLCSSALFMLANTSYEKTLSRNLALTKGMLSLAPPMTLFWFLFAMSNMAAPPFPNLMSEIVLLISVMGMSHKLLLLLMMISFTTTAYTLTLFSSTQHGHPAPHQNPISPATPSTLLALISHLVPLMVFMLKPEMLAVWI